MIIEKDIKIEVLNKREYSIEKDESLEETELVIFDSADNLFNDLEASYKFLKDAKQNEYMYKWALIAIHNALVGFMLIAVKGNSWKNVVKKEKIISTLELYDMVENMYLRNISNKNKVKELVIRLNNLRNNFSHPYYDMSVVDKSLLNKMFTNAIYIIKYLISSSKYIEKELKSIDNKNINNIINKTSEML